MNDKWTKYNKNDRVKEGRVTSEGIRVTELKWKKDECKQESNESIN